MMTNRREEEAFGMISRSAERLADARFLLGIAQDQSDEHRASTLCACACMLCVVALEEESGVILRGAAEKLRRVTPEAAESFGKEKALAALHARSLPSRLLEIPRILSGGRLHIRKSGDRQQSLWALLKARNLLAHRMQDAVIDVSGWEMDPQREDLISALGDDPWRKLAPSQAARFIHAAAVFVAELQELDLDDDQSYAGGEVIGPVGT